ncbi:MAG: hypothetical protein Alis3KO_27400 [Aliiglaciecola sp.]|uniref:methylamine utilization protein n=1 Tax=Aliiglaciecola sp. M165 TaxID=2593649 RepID=UPI00117FA1E6|nr:methylamine utilization protein [Aliiglaciecola sp. M165]TRY30631.1 methylamine utilization protein [Aliiglaciecola sp. M165]
MLRFLVLLLPSFGLMAQPVSVTVTSNKDNPVFQAVVYLVPHSQEANQAPPNDVSVMDQIDRQFVPHILPIQKGSKVIFPNSDSIKHHVYSFSPTKRFELKLYQNSKAESLLFEKDGEVELGCNVHDWMLAYIWVVDTPYFVKTTETGQALLDVPEGKYTLRVWHPRIQDDLDTLAQEINVLGSTDLNVNLTKDLLEDLSLFEDQTDGFSDYD